MQTLLVATRARADLDSWVTGESMALGVSTLMSV